MELKPGYKQTEVGVIPEDWEVIRLDSLISALDAGVSVNSVETEKVGYAHEGSILKTSCVYGGKFDSEEHKKIHPRDIRRAKLNPRKNSILISRMNTPALVGECGFIDRDYPNLFLPDRLWMTRHEGKRPTCILWFSYLLSFGSFNRAIKESATGTSGSMKNISKGSLFVLQVPLPNKIEQEAIAEALSDADAFIESLEQLIFKKRQIKQGVMQELLTGKKRLPGFSGEWMVTSLGEITIATKGSQLHGSESTKDGKYPHLNGGIAPSGYAEKSNTPANTIAISEGGNSCGYVQLMIVPYWCGGHCYSLISKCIDNGFLYQALKVQQTAIMGLRVGSGLPNVQKSALLSFKLEYPSDDSEQTAIAEVLSEMDDEIDALTIKLEKARLLKQAMMHNLLTGKIRLV
ncbi:restriction endonuclease subunit S [Chlorobium ferrooxidans]|uniref:Restriction modification system DNA specificity domain n=1 Tax=Chlorobium ferrooxidans DSM 13031 TaxID=377431 RepID=Q0YSV6_9CHLB|nr:restriction endonuclease subunit S [Chlorobium ferrooxidans]EAT59506.1 Restriction modification system DNA specificity domain [Chlorobium ferrooxidans DSM 13031]